MKVSNRKPHDIFSVSAAWNVVLLYGDQIFIVF